jgi:hypothetical protein
MNVVNSTFATIGAKAAVYSQQAESGTTDKPTVGRFAPTYPLTFAQL